MFHKKYHSTKAREAAKQQFYRQMIYESPFDIVSIRNFQQDLKKHKIEIPIIFCGYVNETGQIEYHPDRYKNTEIKNFVKDLVIN